MTLSFLFIVVFYNHDRNRFNYNKKIEALINERFEAIERKNNKEVLLTEDEASKELKICSKTLANLREG